MGGWKRMGKFSFFGIVMEFLFWEETNGGHSGTFYVVLECISARRWARSRFVMVGGVL